jgi:hypothetical protein
MLSRPAKAKRAKTQLQCATWVALALAVALLMLFLEFDRPLGDPEQIDAVVLGCYKPTGLYASRTHVKCWVKFGAKGLDLWSRETRPSSSHATVLQFRRRYSGLAFYQLADSAPH